MNKFDCIARPVIAFYAALVGFGLKHILDLKAPDDPAEFVALKVPCFVIGVALFVRFLFGSAVHLSMITPNEGKNWLAFTWDILLLITFGVIASLACYAGTLPKFLFWCGVLLATAVGWFVVVALFKFSGRKKTGKGSTDLEESKLRFWVPWPVANVVSGALFFALSYGVVTWGSLPVRVWVLCGLTVVLFLADLLYTVWLAERFPGGKGVKEGERSG